jgi:hypothetical protein
MIRRGSPALRSSSGASSGVPFFDQRDQQPLEPAPMNVEGGFGCALPCFPLERRVDVGHHGRENLSRFDGPGEAGRQGQVGAGL